MNWEDLKLFDAAASSGSLSAGARAMGISQPQMSRRLRDLEDALGARLFDRTPMGLRPTKAGAKLMPLVEEMRQSAELISRVRPILAEPDVPVVRISADEIRSRFLASHLQELQEALPRAAFEIFSSHRHPDHQTRMTDIQIRSCLPDSDTLIAKRIGETSYGLYASGSFLDAHGGSAEAEDVRSLAWIGISPEDVWYPLQKRWLETFFTQPCTLSFNMMTDIAVAAGKGYGLALLPHFMADEDPSLTEVAHGHEPLKTLEYLIVHRDLLRDGTVRQAIDAIAGLYRRANAQLSR